MDSQTKLKVENDLIALHRVRLIVSRYVKEHKSVLKYQHFVDLDKNKKYLSVLCPSLKTINKLIDLFESEYRNSSDF